MKPSDPKKYSKPELRDKIREEVIKGDKGGKAGQWSARKAQLVATEYEHQGGGFKGGKDKGAESLTKWGGEDWHTSDGKKAEREGGTTRYLPDAAWEKLSPEEKAKTNRKKQEGSKKGKQFVANTAEAKEAGAAARKKATPAKKAAAKTSAEKLPAKKAAAKTSAKTTAAKTAAGKAPAKKTAAKKGPAKSSARKAAPSESPAKKKAK